MKSVPLGTIVQKFNEKFIEFGFNIIDDGHIEYNEEVGYALCHWCVGMAMPNGDDTVKYEKCFCIVLDDKEICNIKFYTNVYHNSKDCTGKDWWSLHHVTYCSVSGRTYDLVGKVKDGLIEQMREFTGSLEDKNNQEVAKVTEIKPKAKKKNNKNKKNIKRLKRRTLKMFEAGESKTVFMSDDETIAIGKNVVEKEEDKKEIKETDKLLESINKVIEITKGIDMYKDLDSKAANLNLGLIPFRCQFHGKTSGLDGEWYSIYCTLGCTGENMKFSTFLKVFAKYDENKNEITFETTFEPNSDKNWTAGEGFLKLCVDLLETMKIIFKCAVRLGLEKENVSIKED